MTKPVPQGGHIHLAFEARAPKGNVLHDYWRHLDLYLLERLVGMRHQDRNGSWTDWTMPSDKAIANRLAALGDTSKLLPVDPAKQLFSISDLAREMGISTVLVHRLIVEGRIVPDFYSARKNGEVQQHLFTRDKMEKAATWYKVHKDMREADVR